MNDLVDNMLNQKNKVFCAAIIGVLLLISMQAVTARKQDADRYIEIMRHLKVCNVVTGTTKGAISITESKDKLKLSCVRPKPKGYGINQG